MKDSFRQSMAFLHGWAGLIPGWLLYAVFLTGSLTYYRQEITQWMRPELTGVTADPSAVPHALAWLGEHGQGATLWRIDLPTPRTPVNEVLWKGDGGFASQLLDPRTGGPLRVRETMGGDFLFYFHFDLNAPGSGGRWLVCFAAIIMLVALISGIVTHRRIFADFFTFRPRKGQRSWLDAHNVAGVAALPYHLLISFTGLVALMTMFMPWGIDKAFSGNVSAFRSALAEQTPITFPAGPRAPLRIDAMLTDARSHWHGSAPGRILVEHPGTADALTTIERADRDSISYDLAWRRYRADGALIDAHDNSGPAVAAYQWLYGFHLARFSSEAMRFLFFASGLLATAMIATGLILWVKKRAAREDSAENLAARINVAVIAGLPIGVASLLTANRLIPSDFAGRASLEGAAFFLAWLIMLVHALCVRPARAWRQQGVVLGILCLATPFIPIEPTGIGLLAWIARGNAAPLMVDGALLAAGLLSLSVSLFRPQRA